MTEAEPAVGDPVRGGIGETGWTSMSLASMPISQSLGVYLVYARCAEYSPADREHIVQKLRRQYHPTTGFIE
jgi:hypothetical protein